MEQVRIAVGSLGTVLKVLEKKDGWNWRTEESSIPEDEKDDKTYL